MIKKITAIFPAQSLIFFLICGAGILAFIFLIILPSQKAIADLDVEIDKLEGRIEEQRILTPVFHNFLAKAKTQNPTQLPLKQKTKLARGDLNKISQEIREMVQRNNLSLEAITPDVNSLNQNTGYLLMHLTVSGDYFDFRDLLVDLGSIPSLETIQEIRIRPIEGSREIDLKIWLAQE